MTTKITSMAVVDSTVDNTPVGATTPTTGKFTDVTSTTGEFSGALTAPTVASSDNSNNVATTGWSRFGFGMSLAVNGYIQLPTWLSGLVIQWGTTSGLAGGGLTAVVSFPIPFPSAVYNVVVTTKNLGGGDRISFVSTPPTTSGFTAGNNGSNAEAYWIAIGK